ncbi:FadR/GntR family transcriptional regulator [Actinocorallia aurantiaca]|uniref:FadR/GntR family transcriptional regulator n=1 Tax=Actinocorallia aurantiaca TaxID=46204 RepID=A0ABP6GUB1_9ACTN
MQTANRRYLQVAMQILEAIGARRIPFGSKLPSDRELAELMGVSRPTVREAILALEVVGILQVRSGDGTYVASGGIRSSAISELLSDRSLRVPAAEVLEARLVVEPAAVALTAERISDEAIGELEELLGRAEALVDDTEGLAEFVRLGLRFHAELLKHCCNAHLSAFATALVDLDEHPLWTLLNAFAVQAVGARRQQIEEHRAILQAVRDRDSALASSLVTEHLQHLNAQVDEVKAAGSPRP